MNKKKGFTYCYPERRKRKEREGGRMEWNEKNLHKKITCELLEVPHSTAKNSIYS